MYFIYFAFFAQWHLHVIFITWFDDILIIYFSKVNDNLGFIFAFITDKILHASKKIVINKITELCFISVIYRPFYQILFIES